MARRGVWIAVLVVGLAVVATGCAPGPNYAAQAGGGDPAGFWLGLWQGLISPIVFVISLFTDTINIYEVDNNGNWYNFGFMLGVSFAFGGAAGSGGAGRRRRRRGHA